MPLYEEELNKKGIPISFQQAGQVTVRVGPCSGKSLDQSKIPLDGRHYICAGKVILKNGIELRAHFEINTHTFDFLERNSVWSYLEGAWYQMNEPELYELLKISQDDAFPYTWIPDVPLDYHDPGPYPMKWHSSEQGSL